LHSPDGVFETGLTGCVPEKKAAKLAWHNEQTLSPVRFESESYGIAPISCNFQSNPSGFLCTSDCMAERVGFEPRLSCKISNLEGANGTSNL